MSRIDCKCCLKTCSDAALLYRCRQCEPDGEYPSKLGRIFKPVHAPRRPSAWKRALGLGGRDEFPPVRCSQGHTCFDRLCPNCFTIQTDSLWGVRENTLAIVGASSAGKTVYMTVLAHLISSELVRRFGWSVQGSPADAYEQFLEHKVRPLLDPAERRLPAKNDRSSSHRRPAPLTFRITLPKRRLGIPYLDALNVVFYDIAGEDAWNESSTWYTQYLQEASALMLLLDPARVPGLAERLGLRYPGGDNADAQLQRLLGEFNKFLPPDTPIRKPIAVVLTQTDLLQRELMTEETLPTWAGQWRAVREALTDYELSLGAAGVTGRGTSSPCFDYADVNGYQSELARFLDPFWPNLGTTARDRFRNYGLFALSALGGPASKDGNVLRLDGKVAPFRVEDPFLWSLFKLRFLS